MRIRVNTAIRLLSRRCFLGTAARRMLSESMSPLAFPEVDYAH